MRDPDDYYVTKAERDEAVARLLRHGYWVVDMLFIGSRYQASLDRIQEARRTLPPWNED
jgi:hypothetical protein